MQAGRYSWITVSALDGLAGKRVVLFGAGKGSEEFLAYLAETGMSAEPIAVVDNDASLWGKSLLGLPILSPESLRLGDWDRIVVSSVSGRETISRQLEKMGYVEGQDFLLVGRYPCTG
jgi:FlaA1/EpsC-like NDP-sugar epimerase